MSRTVPPRDQVAVTLAMWPMLHAEHPDFDGFADHLWASLLLTVNEGDDPGAVPVYDGQRIVRRRDCPDGESVWEMLPMLSGKVGLYPHEVRERVREGRVAQGLPPVVADRRALRTGRRLLTQPR